MSRTGYHWLSRTSSIHFVGVGGVGLSAIARVLLEKGYRVSGSDLRLSALASALQSRGAIVREGHHARNIEGASLVVVSSAVPEDNPEVVAARRAGIPVVKRDWILGKMMEGWDGIAVAGTHGKTTTSAMIAWLLEKAGLAPTFIVGGVIAGMGTNARAGRSRYFVVEADEYDRCFLGLSPRIAVVTTVEMDHPDCYRDLGEMRSAFGQFLRSVPSNGLIVAGGDSPVVQTLLDELRNEESWPEIITYGVGSGHDWRAVHLEQSALGGLSYELEAIGQPKERFTLQVPGAHNVANAVAATAVTSWLGVTLGAVRDTLREFGGVRRRFELKGGVGDRVIIDDYAHHPTEVRATLAAARQVYPGRPIWVMFQPHTFSRTGALLEEFSGSFGDADHVIITDIYAARETDTLGVTASQLADLMADHADAQHIGALDEATEFLLRHMQRNAVLITMGAGDGYRVGEEVLAQLRGSRSAGG